MTGYHIRIGYNSGYSTCVRGEQEAWDLLKETVRDLCENHHLIAEEARRLGAPEGTGDDTLTAYAACYQNCNDMTVQIIDTWLDDEQVRTISQAASGGFISRPLKEHLRRAFIRLVMERMHRHGIEISVSVT